MNHEAPLKVAFDHALAFLGSLDKDSVANTISETELQAGLHADMPVQGADAASVVRELIRKTDGGLLGSASGRFFAWVIGGALPAAVAADWLTSVWDQNAVMTAGAPAAAVVEETAGRWLKQLLRLPPDAGFALTTGCQMAHFTCLAAARYSVLNRVGWDVSADGLCGAPPIRIIVGETRHESLLRALRFLGIGERAIVSVPVDANERMRVEALRAELTSRRAPTIIALAAGDLNAGACDPYHEIIPLAHHHDAWVHVDGAFGLVARASQAKRPLLDGVELADSWATDAHKWLNVPFDSGFACVRDRDAHRAAMAIGASYLTSVPAVRDPMSWTPEWSRRARGFALYAALAELGSDGVEQLVDRCCGHASALVRGLGALPGTEVMLTPTLNQGLVRFSSQCVGATDFDHDAWTDEVIRRINATGEAFFGGVTWRGRRAMRVSVVNWRTTDEDVQRAIDAASRVLSPGKTTAPAS